MESGDEALAKLCANVASDESRHEIAYTRIVEEFFKRDPETTMVCWADMMKKQIVMPAHLMSDGEHESKNGRNLFAGESRVPSPLPVARYGAAAALPSSTPLSCASYAPGPVPSSLADCRASSSADFSLVAENTKTYTAFDYADIMEHLNKRWEIAGQSFHTGEAAEAQEYVLALPDRIRKLSERALARKQKAKKVRAQFSWIFDRPLEI